MYTITDNHAHIFTLVVLYIGSFVHAYYIIHTSIRLDTVAVYLTCTVHRVTHSHITTTGLCGSVSVLSVFPTSPISCRIGPIGGLPESGQVLKWYSTSFSTRQSLYMECRWKQLYMWYRGNTLQVHSHYSIDMITVCMYH